MDNIRWRIVSVMFLPSIFENRCGDFRKSMWRLSKIDVSPFDDRCHDVSTFEDRCVDLRRSMCRPSKIDDRRVDLRRSVIDMSIFKDRWSMCRPSKINGRCEIRLLYLFKTLILYISCMRITPRVCTSVLSFLLLSSLWLSRMCVCVCSYIVFCHRVHLHPEI